MVPRPSGFTPQTWLGARLGPTNAGVRDRFLDHLATPKYWQGYSPFARPPRVRAITFLPYNRHICRTVFGQHWTLCCLAHSSVPVRSTMRFLFVGSGVCPSRFLTLTSGFLQIPRLDISLPLDMVGYVLMVGTRSALLPCTG